MRPIVVYDKYDIIKVPFPFTDRNSDKVRPAVIISHIEYAIDTNHYIMIMITSSNQTKWTNDIEVQDLNVAGLPVPSKIRFKIFSLDERLVISKLGTLSIVDQHNLDKVLKKYL